MSAAQTSDELENLAEVFRVIGHETRLRLLTLLLEGERSVVEIEAISGIGQPGLSQQLAVLRKSALVSTRREAKMVFYKVDPAGVTEAVALLNRLSGQPAGGPPPAPQEKAAPARGSAAAFAKIL